ncbi:MAG TPA: HEAT repeat domain-containing protein [Isosphaeraceae bacterium]|jgi:HEAT repeat protein|nr:HEAT repeat domain-containing protein [Isosphaeraceae bacterium]
MLGRKHAAKGLAAMAAVPALLGAGLLLPAGPRAIGQQVRAPAKGEPQRVDSSQARRRDQPPVLDLEDAIGRAELVLAVRLVDVTESRVVHGGKTEVVTQQYKFEPVRALKGIFARDTLLLTGDDLGVTRFADAAEQLRRGQLLLLLLGRNGPGYLMCNRAETLVQSIPRLSGQDDPLIPAVEALIAVVQRRDRAQKVALLVDALRNAKAADAIPLMAALRRRALLASQAPGAFEAIEGFLGDRTLVVREAAARTLESLLDADYLDRREVRARAATKLAEALKGAGPDIALRVALTDALGAAGPGARVIGDERAWWGGALSGTDGPAGVLLGVDESWQNAAQRGAASRSLSLAERAARLRAVGRIGSDHQYELTFLLGSLALDAPAELQQAAARALGKARPEAAAKVLADRIAAKGAAGLGVAAEIAQLGDLPAEFAAPALGRAFVQRLDFPERLAFAQAAVKVADRRLVPALTALLDPRLPQVRYAAIDALMAIDTEDAARAVWPRLNEEYDLGRKLQLAAFIGRHGFRGSYPIAIEHMSNPLLREAAVEALAAINEPRAVPELRKFWESSNDVAWNAAAIRALGRLGQREFAPRMLDLARDPREPLAPSALIALSDLGVADALPIARDGLGSRNDELVIASARAAAKLLAGPDAKAQGADVRDRLAALLADPAASHPVRHAALDALVALDDPRLGPALAAAARDAGLETSNPGMNFQNPQANDLLRRVESLLAARKQPVALK